MVEQHLKALGLRFRARVDLTLFRDLFRERAEGMKVKIPRAMEFNFIESPEISPLIEKYRTQRVRELEEELFVQKKRLADTERKLEQKVTKTAEKEKGIAERKAAQIKARLSKLHAKTEANEDSRIYAFEYAPVIVWEKGERLIKPMRYLLRPAGFPESFDRQYPGCYNARRDSLRKFWKSQFMHQHAALVISSFFENVKLHHYESRKLRVGEEEQNLIIQFKPRGFESMIVPCIWDRWSQAGAPELYSFALITDEPPKEVLAAGHDRCPVFLKEENLDRWLQPELCTEQEVDQILDDRETPFYLNERVA